MFTEIDGQSSVPYYRQIAEQIRRGVAAGTLTAGDQLPSVRELASRLLVNPNTVARCYRDLEQEGLIETRRGEGTYLSQAATAYSDRARRCLLGEQMTRLAADIRAFEVPTETAVDMLRQALQSKEAAAKETR